MGLALGFLFLAAAAAFAIRATKRGAAEPVRGTLPDESRPAPTPPSRVPRAPWTAPDTPAGGPAAGAAPDGDAAPVALPLQPMADADADAAPYIEMTAAAGHARKARYYRAQLATGAEVIVGHTPGADHLDVFAPTRRRGDSRGEATGGRRLYGFDARGSHWTYGDAPYGAREIRAALRHLDPGIVARERL